MYDRTLALIYSGSSLVDVSMAYRISASRLASLAWMFFSTLEASSLARCPSKLSWTCAACGDRLEDVEEDVEEDEAVDDDDICRAESGCSELPAWTLGDELMTEEFSRLDSLRDSFLPAPR